MSDIPVITGEIWRRGGDHLYIIVLLWYRGGATRLLETYRTKKEAEKALSKVRTNLRSLDHDVYFEILHKIVKSIT